MRRKSRTDIQAIIDTAFWSGSISLKKWRQAVVNDRSLRHKTIIKTSFDFIPSTFIVREIGEQNFIKRWPAIRQFYNPADRHDKNRLLLFDSTWGILAVGDSQYPVSENVANLSKGRRALLGEVARWPGISIYDLSKRMERDYSRVFKDVGMLVEQGLVETKTSIAGGRKTSNLYSPESVNTKLSVSQR